MKEKISKKYLQLLDRSFKNDLKLFIFDHFSNGERERINENDYNSFLPNESLINRHRRINQLSKESDLIHDTEIKVGEFDKALKLWMTKNKSDIHSYKNIFKENRFISLEDLEAFYNENSSAHCFYCGITEEFIEYLIKKEKINTKRLFVRGRTLEIDKKDPKGKYEKDNMVLCCYWCNNAKTDEFTHEEFINIGNEIREIWKKRS